MLMKVLTAKKKHYSRKRFNDFLRLFKSLSLRQKSTSFDRSLSILLFHY